MSYKSGSVRTYTDNMFEAVVVCVDYGDFLAESLPLNLPHFDRVVVVTTASDHVTRQVCRNWSVECVLTDAFYEKGELFNKGAGINSAIGHLRCTGWILQLDADIVLPVTFRNMLAKSALHRSRIYGCERANVKSWAKWRDVKQKMHVVPQYAGGYLVSTPDDTPVGAQFVHKSRGYCPIGFFQMWHAQFMHEHELRYPEVEGSAEMGDVQFAVSWKRADRILLPTIRVFHLESESVPMGTNWNGRRTKPFTEGGKALVVDEIAGYGYA